MHGERLVRDTALGAHQEVFHAASFAEPALPVRHEVARLAARAVDQHNACRGGTLSVTRHRHHTHCGCVSLRRSWGAHHAHRPGG